MIRKLIAVMFLCGSLYASDAWVSGYISNEVFRAVGTNQIDTLKVHYLNNGTNEIDISTVKAGDKIIVLLSGTFAVKDPRISDNWVGYIKMNIPTNRAPRLITIR